MRRRGCGRADAAVAAVVERYGRADVLVANAGTITGGPLESQLGRDSETRIMRSPVVALGRRAAERERQKPQTSRRVSRAKQG